MDIERFTHQGYKVSVVIAIVLSVMVVSITALIGRGTLNLRGALIVDEPTDVTVIASVEPTLQKNVTISGITFLRKEKSSLEGEKASYAYLVETSDGDKHLVKLRWDGSIDRWAMVTYESLHGSDPL